MGNGKIAVVKFIITVSTILQLP